jgi:amidohydrolase
MQIHDLAVKMPQLIFSAIERHVSRATALRRELHQRPELKWQEKATSELLRARLTEVAGVQVGNLMAEHGFTATIRGDQSGPTIALRADMDALPIEEQNDLPYCSKNKGSMHACGHDGHMANLFGAASVIAELRAHLRGTVKLIFQPAEEQGGGAKVMCEQGCLQDVETIFGLHGWPSLPVGSIGVKSGPLMAASAILHIQVIGRGGHAAMPHLAVDPVVAAAGLITQLQTVNSRIMAPTSPGVVSICVVQAGTTSNVIPDRLKMSGVIRALSLKDLALIQETIVRQAEGIAQAYGVKIQCDFTEGYPPVINEAAATQRVRDTITTLWGSADSVCQELTEPTMGAEDFAYYLKERPGAFVFLGLADGNLPYPSLHHPSFDFNDKALKTGMALFAGLALIPAP